MFFNIFDTRHQPFLTRQSSVLRMSQKSAGKSGVTVFVGVFPRHLGFGATHQSTMSAVKSPAKHHISDSLLGYVAEVQRTPLSHPGRPSTDVSINPQLVPREAGSDDGLSYLYVLRKTWRRHRLTRPTTPRSLLLILVTLGQLYPFVP